MRRGFVLLALSFGLALGPGTMLAPPAGAETIDSEEFAKDCNADGIFGGLRSPVIVQGGLGELTRDCLVAVALGATLNFVGAGLSSKCCGMTVLGGADTTAGFSRSKFDLAGHLSVRLGAALGDPPQVPGGVGRIWVKGSLLRAAERVDLHASDPGADGTVDVIASDVEAPGGEIAITAGNFGKAFVLNSDLNAGAGNIEISSDAVGTTVATGNDFFTVAPYVVEISTGLLGFCRSSANTPRVPCT